MDVSQRIELIHTVETELYVAKLNQRRADGRLCEWVSTFHSDRLDCYLGSGFLNGSYNVGQKLTFNDGTSWMVRFPLPGNIAPEYADEKVAMEVEVMGIILEKTTIRVPEIKAWGYAAQNPLDLGPFIMMEFIEGVSLSDILSSKEREKNSRLLREDISNTDIEFIYRQYANILLQLWKLDFDQIGSLPTLRTEFKVPSRPLTWKMHDILQTGGVDTFGDRNQGFSTTTEYFQYIVGQDWEQLHRQVNSVFGPANARGKFATLYVLETVIRDFVHPKYDKGPFKLVCDDLGLANLMVRSKDDLTIVGVVDLEWSYIGPAQMLGSVPWSLLQVRLNNWDIYEDEEEAPKITARYLRYMEIFKRVLEEEEAKMPGHEAKELSRLMKWSESSGSMWFHMVLLGGFNSSDSLPFAQVRQRVGLDRWDRHKARFYETKSINEFTERKVAEMEQYEEELEKTKELKADMDHGFITRQEFIATR